MASIERHITWLAKRRQILPLSEYLDRRVRRRYAGRIATLTFDDGLAGMFEFAYPLLLKFGIPATVFVTTSHLDRFHLLWFSYLNALCFEAVYDEVSYGGVTYPLLTTAQRKTARQVLGAQAVASKNPQAFVKALARTYPIPSQVSVLYGGMKREQLATLADCDLLEVGSHTLSHPLLSTLSPDHQATEILESKRVLSELTRRNVRYFAYPGGDYNCQSLDLVREAGYEAAFATIPKQLGADLRFEIGRIGVYSTSLIKFKLKVRGVAALARRLGISVG